MASDFKGDAKKPMDEDQNSTQNLKEKANHRAEKTSNVNENVSRWSRNSERN